MNWLTRQIAPGSICDERAMEDVRAHGDSAAFTHLVRRWDRPIRRLCTRMTGDAHRGEDLAQETFARIFANRRQYEPGRRFSTWLWRIAINLCREDARKSRRASEFALTIASDAHSSASDIPLAPDERAVDNEQADLIRRALAALPEAQRAVVILREYEGLKFGQIADVLDIPEGTAKSRMADALTELARKLKPALIETASPIRKRESAKQRIML